MGGSFKKNNANYFSDEPSETFIKDLSEFNDALDKILYGKKADKINQTEKDCPAMSAITGKMNLLIENINEIKQFADELSDGNLEGEIPPRKNYMAGSLKRLHSQLSILTWSMRQLQQGHIVSKLEETGEVYKAFNDLISVISNSSIYEADTIMDAKKVDFKWSSINSWRFHKILTVLNHLKVAIIEVNENGQVAYANQSGKEILKNADIIPVYDEKRGKDSLLNTIAKYSTKDRNFPVEYEIYDKETALWYKITSDYFSFADLNYSYLHIIENINEWKLSEGQLIKTATTDSMTGTLNREAGLKKLTELLNKAPSEHIHCAAFIDLDGLKEVNDTYGHKEGDYFIKTVSHILLTNIRDTDMVIRYGGDEFLVVFEKCSFKAAEVIIMRMYLEMDKLNAKKVKPYSLSFSHGLVSFKSGSTETLTEVVTTADFNMYENKRAKKLERRNKIKSEARSLEL